MCAVIGAYLKKPSSKDLANLAKVFYESQIRGLHATGVSYIQDGEIKTVIDSKPAEEFLKLLNFKDCINEDGNLYLIGHCRYSTSDLKYNQPLYIMELFPKRCQRTGKGSMAISAAQEMILS